MHGGADPIVILLIVFGMLAIMRRRGFGRYGWGRDQRRLEQEIAELRAEQRAALPSRNAATQDQVQMLEDRVRVLERIVTDRGYGLASEIEALRDRRETAKVEESK